MNLCYARTSSGKHLWYQDFAEASTEDRGPDLYTTLNPRNAQVILSAMRQGDLVAACSDVRIEDGLVCDDPAMLFNAMLDLQEQPGDSTFRYLTSLDQLHFQIQLQWQQPRFRYSLTYLHQLTKHIHGHPLLPYAHFLGLDPAYCVMAAAMWIDPCRWDIAPGNTRAGRVVMNHDIGVDGPSPAVYQHLTGQDPFHVLNNHNYPTQIRSWLILHGCWSAGLSNALKGSNSRLRHLYNETRHQHEKAYGRSSDFERMIHIAMTRLIADYLIAHHRLIINGGTTYSDEVRATLSPYPELAEDYTRYFLTFSSL